MAREALSNGDKILSENYMQHADHFTRILNERETYKREKLSEIKLEIKDNSMDEMKIDSDSIKKNKDDDILEEKETKKITKNQVEIN